MTLGHVAAAAAQVAVLGGLNRTIGLVLAFIVIVGFIVYALVNVLSAGKAEIGSEIELAPNRKPYLPDEELEGPKLDRTLTFGLLTIVVIAIGLPLYWVLEPGRQSGAIGDFGEKFASRGAELFDTTENHGLNCAFCHGGMEATGGTVSYNLQQPDGTVEPVNWKAPALNTVMLRYDREEVEYILVYGRPFSPMPPWGVEGGGPLNDQQIENLIDYLESIQLTPEEAQQEAEEQLEKMMATDLYESEGEALFNMGLDDGFAGGAYACGRCHTPRWSYSDSPSDFSDAGSGNGAFGPGLLNVDYQFPEVERPEEGESPFQEQIDFITTGSEGGVRYGLHGQGSGRMPGFGERPGDPAVGEGDAPNFWINGGEPREPGPGMLTNEMIEEIVEYERSLGSGE
ncbi:hypothetical protein BH18ACT4_BH18ACT4_03410 [soil metagenome]